jgi:hypothetical protein
MYNLRLTTCLLFLVMLFVSACGQLGGAVGLGGQEGDVSGPTASPGGPESGSGELLTPTEAAPPSTDSGPASNTETVVPTPPVFATPTPTVEALPEGDWATATEPAPGPPWVRTYDQLYQVAFESPEAWLDVSQGTEVERRGADGFVRLSGIGAPYDLDEVTAQQAFHKLQPFGSAPVIENLTLRDGRAARLIWPSPDRQHIEGSYAMLLTSFGAPVPVGNHRLNFLMLTADLNHVRRIADSLELPPAPATIGVDFFEVSAEELATGGRRLTFTWDSHGATRGRIVSGTSERFIDWWPVEAYGQHMVDLQRTVFADPIMTLQLFNDVTDLETVETVRLSWPCKDEYFFQPAPEHCPYGEALHVKGAFQQFERGFMIWLPRPDDGYPSIFTFWDSGRVLHYPDTWTAGDPESDPDLEPPQGLHQPVRGFGKVWREYTGLREQLGWATMPEYAYQAIYQIEIRESIPGVSYLTRPDGTILQLVDTRWSPFAATTTGQG